MTNPNDPALPTSKGYIGLTAREHAAIQLRVPASGTPWLDEMIRASLQLEFVKSAMQGYCADHLVEPVEIGQLSVLTAKALTTELEKQK